MQIIENRILPRDQNGISIIEILMIIVMLGILSTVAIRSMKPPEDSSKTSKTRAEIEQIISAIVGDETLVEGGFRSDFGYVGDIGALPPNLDALVTDPGYSTWDGPYIISNFSENSEDYKRDAWNELYTYAGSVTISSPGGGTTISNKFAQNDAAIESNSVTGLLFDGEGSVPGSDASNISVIIYYPDGSGASTTSTVSPDSSGNFTFSGSIPIGNHLIQAIFSTENETTLTYVSVPPSTSANCQLRFASTFSETPPAGNNDVYLSTLESASIGSLSFNDEDVVLLDTDTGDASLFFDGSAVFSANEDVDAFHLLANGNVLLSTAGNATIGSTSFADEDIVEYNPSSGEATIVFDGSAVFSGDEDVVAVHLLSNGNILLSTNESATIGGLSFNDEDLAEYDLSAGTAILYFDGSSVFSGNEDVDAVHVLNNGNIVLSTEGGATIGSLTFEDEDLVEYDPSGGTATMFMNGDDEYSNDEDTDAVHVGSGSGEITGGGGGGSSSSEILRPDGSGSRTLLTSSGCGSNYQCVDESSSDGDATYVSRASSSYAKDVYSIDNPSASSGTIDSVVVHCRARRTKNQGTVRPAIYINSTHYNGTAQGLTTSYVDYSHTWSANPNTGSTWTWTEINNLQAGLRIKGQNSNWPAYCTQVWVEVFYVD